MTTSDRLGKCDVSEASKKGRGGMQISTSSSLAVKVCMKAAQGFQSGGGGGGGGGGAAAS